MYIMLIVDILGFIFAPGLQPTRGALLMDDDRSIISCSLVT